MCEPRLGGGRPVPLRPHGFRVPRPRWQPLRCLGPRLRVWICSAELTTVCVHWNGERNVPCFRVGDDDPCAGCDQGMKRAVEHWIQAQPIGERGVVRLCPLTPCAVGSEPLLEEYGRQLYGRQLEIWRLPEQPRGRMYCRLVPGMEAQWLPDCLETLDALQKCWQAPIRRINLAPAEPALEAGSDETHIPFA
jgi:hypothetical protein